MEGLSVLEKKIASLIELVRELKAEKSLLIEENMALKEKIEKMESSLLLQGKHAEEEHSKSALTQRFVDDLIKSIDLLVEQEHQQ